MTADYAPIVRQVTGDPFAYYGYAIRDGELIGCGHKHRAVARDALGRFTSHGEQQARECAAALVARLNTGHAHVLGTCDVCGEDVTDEEDRVEWACGSVVHGPCEAAHIDSSEVGK